MYGKIKTKHTDDACFMLRFSDFKFLQRHFNDHCRTKENIQYRLVELSQLIDWVGNYHNQSK
jgi:hypothetical protein